MTLDEIVKKLYDRRPGVIAAATGLKASTISQIRNKRITNPSWRSVDTLDRYFRALEESEDAMQRGETRANLLEDDEK